MSLTYVHNVDPEKFTPRFKSILGDFASAVAKHRYAIDIIVTNGWRDNDKNSHGMGEGCDIRGRLPGWEGDKYLKLALFLCAQWAEACARNGLSLNQWGFGMYPPGSDDAHFHLDIRPHTKLFGAIWIGRE